MRKSKEEPSLPPIDQIVDQAKQIRQTLGTKVSIGLSPDGVTLTPGKAVEVASDETITPYDMAARISLNLGRHVTYTADPLPGETAGYTIKEELPKD